MGAGASIKDADVSSAIEKCKDLLARDKCRELWARIDFNGNGYVSLAEIDKMVVEMQNDPESPFQGFNNKPALMRAYKASCMGGKKADWVERKEFPFLIRNLFFFDKLWDIFDDIDKDDDRRISQDEFQVGCQKSALIDDPSPEEIAQVFDEMDTNDGNQILFDEFCVYTANKFVNAAELDACFEGTPAAGKPPRPIGKKKKKKGRSGTSDDVADIHTQRFDEAEGRVLAQLSDKAFLDETWAQIDFNGNNKVSLAEFDKMIVEQPDWQICNNKPALMRAYKWTCSAPGGGDGDAWVEKKEFKALLGNIFFYNKLFLVFDDIDTGDDRRIDFGEFIRGCSRLGLQISVKDAEKAFDDIDRNDGGQILFDEFCRWVVVSKIPVD